MANQKLLAIVTALMIAAGAPAANATYTLTDLQTIELLILERSWYELRLYIEEHPELLEGDDLLAVALREYLATYRSNFFARLFNPPQAPSMDLLDQLVAQY